MNFTKADRMCYAKQRFPSLIKAHCALGKMLADILHALKGGGFFYSCIATVSMVLPEPVNDFPNPPHRGGIAENSSSSFLLHLNFLINSIIPISNRDKPWKYASFNATALDIP